MSIYAMILLILLFFSYGLLLLVRVYEVRRPTRTIN